MTKSRWMALAAALQVVVVLGMFVRAWYPLWIGQEIRLDVRPVDPRSLFRGHYAELGYPAAGGVYGQIDEAKPGEVVWVGLKPEGDIWVQASLSRDRPDTPVAIRGRVDGSRVRMGLEAYFAPEVRSKDLERQVASRKMVARVRVAPTGRAALVDVEPR